MVGRDEEERAGEVGGRVGGDPGVVGGGVCNRKRSRRGGEAVGPVDGGSVAGSSAVGSARLRFLAGFLSPLKVRGLTMVAVCLRWVSM